LQTAQRFSGESFLGFPSLGYPFGKGSARFRVRQIVAIDTPKLPDSRAVANMTNQDIENSAENIFEHLFTYQEGALLWRVQRAFLQS
jgi:hypothetical protein